MPFTAHPHLVDVSFWGTCRILLGIALTTNRKTSFAGGRGSHFFSTPKAPTKTGRPPTVGKHVLSATLTTPRLQLVAWALARQPGADSAQNSAGGDAAREKRPSEDPRCRHSQSEEVAGTSPEGSTTEAWTPHEHQRQFFAASVTSRSQVQPFTLHHPQVLDPARTWSFPEMV